MDIPCTDNNRQLKSKAYLYQRTVSMNLKHGGFKALLSKINLSKTEIFRAEPIPAGLSFLKSKLKIFRAILRVFESELIFNKY